MTRNTLAVSLLALALGAFALAGCGGSSKTNTTASAPLNTPTTPSTTTQASTEAPAPAGALAIEANPEGQLKYSKSALTAKAGKVVIDFTNKSPIAHNFTIESSAHKILGATPTFQGGSKTLTLDLTAGTYKFFCSVPGHRMAGMEGTLTVK